MMGVDLLVRSQGYIEEGILNRLMGAPQLWEATMQPFSDLTSPKECFCF